MSVRTPRRGTRTPASNAVALDETVARMVQARSARSKQLETRHHAGKRQIAPGNAARTRYSPFLPAPARPTFHRASRLASSRQRHISSLSSKYMVIVHRPGRGVHYGKIIDESSVRSSTTYSTQEQPQVFTSAVCPKGHVPSTSWSVITIARTLVTAMRQQLTCSERK